jgi:hypothetical protein
MIFYTIALIQLILLKTIDSVLESLLQCARQGFALGLTILVGTIHSIKLDSLLKLIVDSLDVSSSMKGQVG